MPISQKQEQYLAKNRYLIKKLHSFVILIFSTTIRPYATYATVNKHSPSSNVKTQSTSNPKKNIGDLLFDLGNLVSESKNKEFLNISAGKIISTAFGVGKFFYPNADDSENNAKIFIKDEGFKHIKNIITNTGSILCNLGLIVGKLHNDIENKKKSYYYFKLISVFFTLLFISTCGLTILASKKVLLEVILPIISAIRIAITKKKKN